MCRRIEEEVEPTVGLPRHRHFVGFFNVPVQAPTRDPPLYGYSEKPPHFSRLLRHAWGYGGHILDLNPPGPHGELRFCHRSDGRYGFEKNISSCTVSFTALPLKTDLHFQPTLS